MNGNNWELNGQQSKELRLALTNAFLEESILKRIVWENLNQRLDEIASGNNIGEKIYSLIDWANSEGKVRELVKAAAYEKSNNSKIQEFAQKNINNLIDFDTELLSAKLLVSLLTLLQKISDFPALQKISKTILPETVTTDRPDESQNLEQPDLSNWLKCFTLLKLLLEDYPGLPECPNILIFVDRLVKESGVDNSIKQDLNQWLHEVDPKFNRQSQASEQDARNASNQPVSGTLRVYLMILVSSEKSKSKVRVSASLRCISPTGDQKEIPVHLNPESHERGVLCTKKKLPQTVAQFIKTSLEENLNSPEKWLGCANYDLMIELFLPSEYLCEPINHWDVENAFNEKVSLGSEHLMVVRSYDRFADKTGRLKNSLSKSWQSAKEFLEQHPPDEELHQKKIKHLDKIDCHLLTSLQQELETKIGLKVSCTLPESEREMLKFFKTMLRSGIPIAFWTRCRELCSDEVVSGIDQFLTTKLLLNPCELLEKVKTERASAFDYCGKPEKRWVRHLTVLWDDWERMPTLEPLQPGGPRSA